MFSNAWAIAKQFTFPVIISSKNVAGACSSGIGTFVMINEDGWFVTAFHILEQVKMMEASMASHKQLLAKRKLIEDDTKLLTATKKKQLAQLKIDPNAISNYSILMGWPGVTIGKAFVLPEMDLAVGQLHGFDKSKVLAYPQFKDPSKPMEPGTSLCKLGFPFHSIVPTFNGTSFVLPNGSMPVPLFPMDGIFTRKVSIKGAKSYPFPLSYIETSTPGLRGQSGGPTYDIHGAIWAIQSQTMHLPLGFGNSQIKTKESEYVKNQYLNVGWGIHAETLIGFFNQNNISFHTSPY